MRLRCLSVVALALVDAVALAPVVHPHANLYTSSPLPGSTVGGELSPVITAFDQQLKKIDDAYLLGVDGNRLAASWRKPAENVLSIKLDVPLTQEGTYWFGYRVVGTDNEDTPAEIPFNYSRLAESAPEMAFETITQPIKGESKPKVRLYLS